MQNLLDAEELVDPNQDECASCHAAILWLVNDKTTRRAPLDAVPNPAGNCWRVGANLYHVRAKVAGEWEPIPVDAATGRPYDLFMPHFATCDARKEWKGQHRR